MIFLLSTYSRDVPTLHPYAWKGSPSASPCVTGTHLPLPFAGTGHLQGGATRMHHLTWVPAPPSPCSLLQQYHSFTPVFLYQFLATVDLWLAWKANPSCKESKAYIPQPGQSQGTGGQSNLFPPGPSGTQSDQTNPGLWHVSGRQVGRWKFRMWQLDKKQD